MKRPKLNSRRQGCVVFGSSGATLYCNRAMLGDIAAYVLWMSRSKPTEHYECHFLWHLGDPLRKKDKRLFALRDSRTGSRAKRVSDKELTIMQVTDADVEALRTYEESGVLPSDWRRKAEDEQDK
jgi:hypothetical protein